MRTFMGSVAAVSVLVAAGALPAFGIAGGTDGPVAPAASSTASADEGIGESTSPGDGSGQSPSAGDGSDDATPADASDDSQPADDAGDDSQPADDAGDDSRSADEGRNEGGPPPWAHNGGRGRGKGHVAARGDRHRSGHGAEMSALGRAHGAAMRAWGRCVSKAATAHPDGEPFDPTAACGDKPTPPGHLKKTGRTG